MDPTPPESTQVAVLSNSVNPASALPAPKNDKAKKPSKKKSYASETDSDNDLAASAGKEISRKGSKKRRNKHKKIHRDHPEFELTYDMMLGIRTTVGMSESKPLRDLTVADFAEEARLPFRSEGSSLTPAHSMRDFKFKDYAPEVFRHLRQRFGIQPVEYIITVCGNFELLEFISNSKSGQFFFYTHDRQFMIKTVTQAECKFLRKILPHYYHVLCLFFRFIELGIF
jgi:1-phosphatidylinositol-4-phosphate 5-kinase